MRLHNVIAFLFQLALHVTRSQTVVGVGTFLCRNISKIGLHLQDERKFIEGRNIKQFFINFGTVLFWH